MSSPMTLFPGSQKPMTPSRMSQMAHALQLASNFLHRDTRLFFTSSHTVMSHRHCCCSPCCLPMHPPHHRNSSSNCYYVGVEDRLTMRESTSRRIRVSARRFSLALAALVVCVGAPVSHAFVPTFPTRHVKIASSKSRQKQPLNFSPTRTSQSHQIRTFPSLVRLQDTPNGDSTTTPPVEFTEKDVRVYPQRWIQLAYLSILALMSDWICFSVAAAPDTYQNSFGHSAASLIDMFLFMNVASCFVVTDVVDKFGMKRSISGAALLMTLGCWLRSGVSFISMGGAADSLVPYPVLVIGTLMVGAAQPFFQCTPPLLSAQWFASSERATSTAVALNFNQIGIATAFLVGGAMATTTQGLEQYFGLIAVLCTLVFGGTLLQFENLPPTPPSMSELEKWSDKEAPFLESVQKFFKTPGFTLPLAAFICSISITNVVGVSVLACVIVCFCYYTCLKH